MRGIIAHQSRVGLVVDFLQFVRFGLRSRVRLVAEHFYSCGKRLALHLEHQVKLRCASIAIRLTLMCSRDSSSDVTEAA